MLIVLALVVSSFSVVFGGALSIAVDKAHETPATESAELLFNRSRITRCGPNGLVLGSAFDSIYQMEHASPVTNQNCQFGGEPHPAPVCET
jgi:hypothetical protein